MVYLISLQGNVSEQYVSRKEFQDLTKKCELLEQRLAETKSEVASLQSTTIVILKRLLQENPGNCKKEP